MTSLATIRTRARQRLDDVGATVFTDAELQEHIEAALRDLSVSVPREQKTAVATINGSRDITLALTDRIDVVGVEFPTGGDPRKYTPFSVWGDVLTLTGDTVGTGGKPRSQVTRLRSGSASRTP